MQGHAQHDSLGSSKRRKALSKIVDLFRHIGMMSHAGCGIQEHCGFGNRFIRAEAIVDYFAIRVTTFRE
jgi:hypothetical protein